MCFFFFLFSVRFRREHRHQEIRTLNIYFFMWHYLRVLFLPPKRSPQEYGAFITRFHCFSALLCLIFKNEKCIILMTAPNAARYAHNDGGECFMVDHNAEAGTQPSATWCRDGTTALLAGEAKEWNVVVRPIGGNATAWQCLPRVSKNEHWAINGWRVRLDRGTLLTFHA